MAYVWLKLIDKNGIPLCQRENYDDLMQIGVSRRSAKLKPILYINWFDEKSRSQFNQNERYEITLKESLICMHLGCDT